MRGKAASDRIGIDFIFIKNLGSFVKPDLSDCQGFAINDDSFSLVALALEPSSCYTAGVNIAKSSYAQFSSK